MQYNLGDIRRCARQISAVVHDLKGDTQRQIGQVEDTLYPNFRGEAARAFQRALGQIEDELAAIIKSLDGIGNELEAFAKKLEEADQLAKMLIMSEN